jgi:protein TonB
LSCYHASTDKAAFALYTPLKDRLVAALGAALIVVLLGYMLLSGLTVRLQLPGEQALALLNLRAPPPPPPPPPPPRRPEKHERSLKKSGKASPRNLRNKATPIVAPTPIVLPPPLPPPVIAAPKPNIGMAPQSGASNRPGPGQGAGGEGNGNGSGDNGEGEGAGDIPPRQIGGKLKFSDLPADLRASGALTANGRRLRVWVEFVVDVHGRVPSCTVTHSSGYDELDQRTCQLIEQRFRFKPGREADGTPFQSTITQFEEWAIDRDIDPPKP